MTNQVNSRIIHMETQGDTTLNGYLDIECLRWFPRPLLCSGLGGLVFGSSHRGFFDLVTTSQIVSSVDRQLKKSNTLLIDPLVSTEPGRMADCIARGLDPRLEERLQRGRGNTGKREDESLPQEQSLLRITHLIVDTAEPDQNPTDLLLTHHHWSVTTASKPDANATCA